MAVKCDVMLHHLQWVECSPVVRETRVQSQIEWYQRLKKWYLMQPWLILSIIRYWSKIKWSNPENGVAPYPTPRYSSYWKESLRVTLDQSCQLYLLYIIIKKNYGIHICWIFITFIEITEFIFIEFIYLKELTEWQQWRIF